MFRYFSLGSHLVAAVLYGALQRNTAPKGLTILTYAKARLFGPHGITTEPASEPADPDRSAMTTPLGTASTMAIVHRRNGLRASASQPNPEGYSDQLSPIRAADPHG